MRRAALALVPLAVLALVACGSRPEQATPPGPRVLIESQMRVFTDRVIALDPDAPSNILFPADHRASIEEQGRAVCSHMIAGVPVDQAFTAAWPRAPLPAPGSREEQTTQIAADTLCPTT